jgi:hypothetical protein
MIYVGLKHLLLFKYRTGTVYLGLTLVPYFPESMSLPCKYFYFIYFVFFILSESYSHSTYFHSYPFAEAFIAWLRENLPCGAEPGFELGPTVQEASALPTESRCTAILGGYSVSCQSSPVDA